MRHLQLIEPYFDLLYILTNNWGARNLTAKSQKVCCKIGGFNG